MGACLADAWARGIGRARRHATGAQNPGAGVPNRCDRTLARLELTPEELQRGLGWSASRDVAAGRGVMGTTVADGLFC